MNHLAYSLGLSRDLAFYDIYSLHEPTLLAMIPRPVHALLVIIPLTPTWAASREAEDASKQPYSGSGPSEPVIWFKQTIGHACGSIGLLHCLLNGVAAEHITPGSVLDQLRRDAIPLKMAERAQILYDSAAFETAHGEAAKLGDTTPPDIETAEKLGQHFVAFVKADGKLWELEGARMGPLERGELGDDEDVLSEKALGLGLERLMGLERQTGGDLRFSCIALAKKMD
jgi:ubiquitin carboxyl-terminal hydrolase L3